MSSHDDIAQLSFERALEELDGLIERLERGAVGLDEAVSCYERGMRLAQHCGQLLDRTEQTVTQLVVGGSGMLQERPFDAEAASSPAPGAPPPAATEPAGRPSAPPPPGAPYRARAVRDAPPPVPGLFGEGDLPVRRRDEPPIDPDEIPF